MTISSSGTPPLTEGNETWKKRAGCFNAKRMVCHGSGRPNMVGLGRHEHCSIDLTSFGQSMKIGGGKQALNFGADDRDVATAKDAFATYLRGKQSSEPFVQTEPRIKDYVSPLHSYRRQHVDLEHQVERNDQGFSK
jgi:hypothetical protein